MPAAENERVVRQIFDAFARRDVFALRGLFAADACATGAMEDLFPGGAKAGWWFKAVQLDLEAKAVLVREPTKPLRIRRA